MLTLCAVTHDIVCDANHTSLLLLLCTQPHQCGGPVWHALPIALPCSFLWHFLVLNDGGDYVYVRHGRGAPNDQSYFSEVFAVQTVISVVAALFGMPCQSQFRAVFADNFLMPALCRQPHQWWQPCLVGPEVVAQAARGLLAAPPSGARSPRTRTFWWSECRAFCFVYIICERPSTYVPQ